MEQPKPRRVKATITRTVIERAIVVLDRDGHIEEVAEVFEELESFNEEIKHIDAVLTDYS